VSPSSVEEADHRRDSRDPAVAQPHGWDCPARPPGIGDGTDGDAGSRTGDRGLKTRKRAHPILGLGSPAQDLNGMAVQLPARRRQADRAAALSATSW